MKRKKLLSLLIILITFYSSCSDETSNEMNHSANSEEQTYQTSTFIYNNQKFTIKFKENQNGEYIPIEDESLLLLNNLNEKNESLITYIIDNDNFILFENNDDLSNYLNETKTTNKYMDLKSSTPYDDPNSLRIYANDNFNTEIYWWSGLNNGGYGNTSQYACYFSSGNNQDRLKNFAIPAMWTVYQASTPLLCTHSNNPIGNNPNDKTSSVKVSNCYARFYEHVNYGGKSFVIDARYSPQQINNLSSIRFSTFNSWNDRISSVSLSY